MLRPNLHLGMLLLTLTLASCASHAPRPFASPTSGAETQTRRAVLTAISAQLGAPYEYGGETPTGFDCSGLVQYAYAQAGVDLPRTTAAQWEVGERVDLAQARPGDLLFYRFPENWSGLHVGIYVGNGRMAHASTSLGRIHATDVVHNPFWRERFLSAVRIVP